MSYSFIPLHLDLFSVDLIPPYIKSTENVEDPITLLRICFFTRILDTAFLKARVKKKVLYSHLFGKTAYSSDSISLSSAVTNVKS